MAETNTNTNTYSNVFLDGPGVKYLWGKIKDYVTKKEVDINQIKKDLKDVFASADSVTKESLTTTLESVFIKGSELAIALDDYVQTGKVEEMVESSVSSVISEQKLVTTDKFDTWKAEIDATVGGIEATATSAEKQAAEATQLADMVSGEFTAFSAEINNQFNTFQQTVNQQIASVYSFQGTLNAVPTLSDTIKTGYVYNISKEFPTTNDFIEGLGYNYPAGTNIVCVTADGVKKWDVLAGVFEIQTLSTEEIDELLK